LKLKRVEPLSRFAFNFNVRRYTQEGDSASGAFTMVGSPTLFEPRFFLFFSFQQDAASTPTPLRAFFSVTRHITRR